MIDFLKVYPQLKPAFEDNLAVQANEKQSMQLEGEDAPVMQYFVEGLKITYIFDEGSFFRTISNRELVDVALKDLHEAAMENMYNIISEQLSFQGDPAEVIMITNGGDYEAAMMLEDGGFWEQVEEIMEGEYYVAVPAKDILLVAPKANPNSINKLTELIDNFFNHPEANGLLVRNIYQRVDNRWTLAKTV